MVAFKEFAHPASDIFSAMETIGPSFFLATAMFGFVFQISSLVAEKELKLRQVSIFSLGLSLIMSLGLCNNHNDIKLALAFDLENHSVTL